MEGRNILSLLGLALRGGRLAVGEEPVEAVARARDARLLLAASDAAEGTLRRVARFAQTGQCLWVRVPFSKAELGQALGRSSAAVAAVTDVGLAHAVAQRLAQLDPAQYAGTEERLALKAQRAAERRAEQAAHERNIRQGKQRSKAPPPPADPPRKAPAQRRAQPEGPRPQGAAKPRRSRPPKDARPKPRAQARFAHSRPVKKGKGSFRKGKES